MSMNQIPMFFYFKTNNFQMKPLHSKSDLRIPTTRKHIKINFKPKKTRISEYGIDIGCISYIASFTWSH